MTWAVVRAAVLTLVVALCFFAGEAAAWGDAGHRIVCRIAYLELTPPARATVDRLIALDPDYDTFADACTWPDHPNRRGPEHYVNVPRSFRTIGVALCPMAPVCLFTGIARDRAVLRNPRSSAAARLAALKYLGHWIGDLHQPLHVSFRDDRGDNDVRTAGAAPGTLHGVWDLTIVNSIPGDVDAIAGALRARVTAADRAAWTRSTVVDWASESLALAMAPTTRYCLQRAGACRYGAARRVYRPGEPKRTVLVDRAYLARQRPIVESRLTRAGVRLGHLLNGMFERRY